ncbi:MAG: glycosyltransferase family 4 protein [Candidatus Woesearchaeota archaeon]
MINILHISPNFNYTCGVSKYLTIILSELVKYPELKIHFITNGGDSLERLESIGINPYIMKFDTGIKNVLYVRKNLKELESFCRLNKINIIHTHHRYPEFLANQLKHKLKIKTVTTVHSLVEGFKKFSFKSDKIIAVSKTVEKNLLRNFYVNPSKIVQLYNPIDLSTYNNQIDNYTFELEHIILNNYKVLLFIGRNDKLKGLDILIKAFIRVSKAFNNVALVIVSNLTYKEKKKILSKHKRIFICPPSHDMSKYYKNAQIIILPSIIESFPYVMLETGFFGKLFIGSDIEGISEFIENGVNGILFKKNDYKDLINKLYMSLNLEENKKNKIANNLYEKVLTLNSKKEYVMSLIKIYTEVVNTNEY